ncbi:hypothetical protein V6N13_019896 [Hibiscus sabdariffa]
MDLTLGAMTNAPKGALDAINTHHEAQHATSTHQAPREAICSMLGLHQPIRPIPFLGAQEACPIDMAGELPGQCPSF